MVEVMTRAAIAQNQRITGLSWTVVTEFVAEVGPLWQERHQAQLASRDRKRAAGAGARHKLVFVDRLPATLAHLRHGTTQEVLACWFGVDRSVCARGRHCGISQTGRYPSPAALSPRSGLPYAGKP
ncbi:helix-turn-helix domain-containing protein [Streptomyces griseocarneus]|uniref:helix-turn-helix domain-containing protein n=1 Tax=Streptomyces griseocarneus TaxID=51201 RepID=UPI001E4E0120|nr:transposase family protein [Streptomyces griseocarneus]